MSTTEIPGQLNIENDLPEEPTPLVDTDPKPSKKRGPGRPPGARNRTTKAKPDGNPRNEQPKNSAGRFASSDAVLKEKVGQLHAIIGLGVSGVLPKTGTVTIEKSGECAEALVQASKSNPSLRRALEKLTTGGDYTAIFAAYSAIGMTAYAELNEKKAAKPRPAPKQQPRPQAQPSNPFTAARESAGPPPPPPPPPPAAAPVDDNVVPFNPAFG